MGKKEQELAARKSMVVDIDSLGTFLEDQTRTTYENLVEDQRLDRGLVKSYLIESHLGGSSSAEALRRLLKRTDEKHGKFSFEVQEFQDPRLLRLAVAKNKSNIDIFVDCSEKRFWTLFSVDDATDVNTAIEKLVLNDCSLDHVWLPQSFLCNMMNWGTLRSLKLHHNRDDLNRSAQAKDTKATRHQQALRLAKIDDRMTYELKGTTAHEGYEALLSRPKLRDYVNVAGLQIRRLDGDLSDYGEDEEPLFSIDDIRYNGKFTTRGTSIEQHLKLLDTTRRRYSDSVETIEAMSIGMKSGRFKGSPFIFQYGRQVEDLPGFITSVFTGREPFRLWGIARKLGREAYRVTGTDVHSGSKFHAEIFRTYLRFYLHDGGCGNSIPRFWANLQQHFSASTALQNHKGEEFLTF